MKWPSKLALLFLLIFFGLGLGYYYSFHWRSADADRLRSLVTWGLARYLATTYPQSRTLVVSNPFSQAKGINMDVVNQEVSGIDGLKNGFGRSITEVTVAYPTLKEGALVRPQSFITDPNVTTPLSFLVEPSSFDQIEMAHPNHELWVSLIGLPIELNSVKAWNRPGPPSFALVLPDLNVIGSKEILREWVLSDKLVAFVVTKPGVTFDTEDFEGDLQVAFDNRYLLVTRENIDEVLESHHGLFAR